MMVRGTGIWRVWFIAGLIVLLQIGLGVRLAFLHLKPDAERLAKVENLHAYNETILVGRGRIYDRYGRVLAMDLPTKDVFADPQRIAESGYHSLIARQLTTFPGVNAERLKKRLLRTDRRFEYVRRWVPFDEAEQLAHQGFPGVHFTDSSKRHYPFGTMMSHVIGFSNMEGVGSAGVEMRYDSKLKGKPGKRVGERDARRREIYNRRTLDISPQKGANVYLTLDSTIQRMLEDSLQTYADKHSVKSAWAIVQKVDTGEILAMSSLPGYDLNEYPTSTEEERRNRAISFIYEPGSTFKVPVIAAALEEGVVTPETLIDCEHGYWVYNRRALRDAHGYGMLKTWQVVQKSSNIGTAKIAIRLGPHKLERYIRAFGFGEKLGIELGGEEYGIIHAVRNWSAISITRIPMGHEVGVTALQMVNAVNAIANDGFLMRPSIIKRVTDSKGAVIEEFKPEVLGRPVSAKTAAIMCEMMGRVTKKGGTGTNGAIDGIDVGGKTGTAQKPGRGGYIPGAYISSFVGFFPLENPEVTMIVVMDEPHNGHYGGTVAAPVFREVGEQLIRYMGTRSEDYSYAARQADEIDLEGIL